jgi:hypothetical protein
VGARALAVALHSELVALVAGSADFPAKWFRDLMILMNIDVLLRLLGGALQCVRPYVYVIGRQGFAGKRTVGWQGSQFNVP